MKIRKYKETNEKLNEKIKSNSNKLGNLSEIVEQLQSWIIQHTRANRVLSEKITANELRIAELNAIIYSQSDELKKLSQKIQSMELNLHQMNENDKENISKQQQQQLIKLSVSNECIQSSMEKCSNVIEELHGKNIELENDKNEKMRDFELRIQKLEENQTLPSKFGSKLDLSYGTIFVFGLFACYNVYRILRK